MKNINKEKIRNDKARKFIKQNGLAFDYISRCTNFQGPIQYLKAVKRETNSFEEFKKIDEFLATLESN